MSIKNDKQLIYLKYLLWWLIINLGISGNVLGGGESGP